MGYYIAVPCRSQTDQARMLAFMEKHFKPSQTLLGWLTDDRGIMPTPAKGEDVCAYARPLEVGFYYNVGWESEEVDYARALCRWMALKVSSLWDIKDGPVDKAPIYFYERALCCHRRHQPPRGARRLEPRMGPGGQCRLHSKPQGRTRGPPRRQPMVR